MRIPVSLVLLMVCIQFAKCTHQTIDYSHNIHLHFLTLITKHSCASNSNAGDHFRVTSGLTQFWGGKVFVWVIAPRKFQFSTWRGIVGHSSSCFSAFIFGSQNICEVIHPNPSWSSLFCPICAICTALQIAPWSWPIQWSPAFFPVWIAT